MCTDWKEEIKLSLVIDDTIVYVIPKDQEKIPGTNMQV